MLGRATWRWGGTKDIPVPGDYAGAGHAGMEIWRPATGAWYRFEARPEPIFGINGDIPL